MAYTADNINKLFIAKRTQVEMLADRGYFIPQEENELFLQPESLHPTPDLYRRFVEQYTVEGRFSRENMAVTYINETNQLTYVYYTPSSKNQQGVGVLANFIEAITSLAANYGIIVSNENFTPVAKESLDKITQPVIQVFFDHQLYVNPTMHVLTPLHVRLNDEERRNFLTTSKIQPRMLLTLSIDDPIVRYYGWSVGDIIRIHRVNLATTKTMVRTSIAFRMVGRIRFDQEKKIPASKVTY